MAHEKKDTLVLIDGHALVYRAYHAFPPLTTSDGELVNAVYGFSRILLKVIKDLHPKYIAVAFDMGKPTFRHTAFAGYKAQRKETPTDLISQLGRVRDVVESLNIPIFGVEGYEADDVIGTIAKEICNTVKVTIVTGDKDAFQLVDDDKITVYMPARQNEDAKEYGEEEVLEKMGVPPSGIIDYKALSGDPSDNIPGVQGVGPKTATQLLSTFGSLKNIYESLQKPEELTPDQKAVLKERVVKKLADGHESALLSQKLATIDIHTPLNFDLDACTVTSYDKQKVAALFEKLGFKSLINLLPEDQFEQGVQEALF
ncbi:MAG TPA: 5'-3' exonuclease H3TH domain-containing protein [Patescibacteria group bacterium]|nr:5'-3' exonuclease H3TH domain-containing protein [Patescibacteria group bacterium]